MLCFMCGSRSICYINWLLTFFFILVEFLATVLCLVNCSFHVENDVLRPVWCVCLVICFYDTDLALITNRTHQKWCWRKESDGVVVNIFSFYRFILFYAMGLSVCLPHVTLVPTEVRKMHQVSYNCSSRWWWATILGAGNWTWVSYKSTNCS